MVQSSDLEAPITGGFHRRVEAKRDSMRNYAVSFPLVFVALPAQDENVHKSTGVSPRGHGSRRQDDNPVISVQPTQGAAGLRLIARLGMHQGGF